MKKVFILFVIATLVILALSLPAIAKDKYVIKIANVTAPEHPLHVGFEKMASIMNDRSEGRIEATAYPSAQLGNLRAIAEGLQLGTIEIGTQSPGGLASFMPLLGVLELPYIYRDNQHVYDVVDGEIGKELNELFRKKTGIRILGYWMNLYRNTTNSSKAIVKPEDFKGLKIRVPETKTVMDTIAALGASPVPMPFGDVYTSLQQGVIDGQENPISIIWASKLYEVQKYLSLTGHIYSPVTIIISDQFYENLPEDLKKIVVDAFEEVKPEVRKIVEDQEKELLQKLKDNGMEINEIDKSEFAEYMGPIYDEFIKTNGEAAEEYIERIKKVN